MCCGLQPRRWRTAPASWLAIISASAKCWDMETFVRWCAIFIEVFVKAFILMGCWFFGHFAFQGWWGDYRFSPQLLPVTAFCVAFAALMVTPRRWMPSRWLQDVTLRRRVCIALTLCAPLAHAASLLFSEISYLLASWGEWVEVLRVTVILFAVLASRWWAVEPPVSPYLRLRAALLPLLLFLVYIGTHPKHREGGIVWFYYLLVAIVVVGIAFTFRRGQGRGVKLESKAE